MSRLIGTSCKNFYVYMTASRARGVLYVGVTSDLPARSTEHREKLIEGFTTRYWVGRLVYYERQPDAETAFRREKLLKRWRRDWKIALIEKDNPTWRDLHPEVLAEHGFSI
jgi:putative endonuclease